MIKKTNKNIIIFFTRESSMCCFSKYNVCTPCQNCIIFVEFFKCRRGIRVGTSFRLFWLSNLQKRKIPDEMGDFYQTTV